MAYGQAEVKRSVIDRVLPVGASYADNTFEMRLFHNNDFLVNGVARIDPFDGRGIKPIRGEVILMSDVEITHAVLYYNGIAIAEHIRSGKAKKTSRIVIDWCIVSDDQMSMPAPLGTFGQN